jgi:hypothetical protein
MENEIEQRLRELAELINAEHRAFAGTFRRALEQAIRAGELLARAKEHHPHGTWQRWLEENFEGSVRTAQEYMRLYRHRHQIRANARDAAHLSIGEALSALASPRGEPARIEVVEPERNAGPTEFTLERTRPLTPPTIQMPFRYRTAEPEDAPQSSPQQGEAPEKAGAWQQIDNVSQVIYLAENDLFDPSNEKLVEQLRYLRDLLNELDL